MAPISLETEATISEIHLSWLPPLIGNYDGYIVTYENDELGRTESPVVLERNQDPSQTLEGLEPDTLYDVSIQMYSGDGDLREVSTPISDRIMTRKYNTHCYCCCFVLFCFLQGDRGGINSCCLFTCLVYFVCWALQLHDILRL